MSDFVIRAPHPDEAEVLAELHLRTWAETYRDHFPPSAWGDEAREQRMRMWTAICALPDDSPHRIAIAERDGVPVGLAGAGPNDDENPVRERQLFFIYLLASEQGSGAG